MLTVSNGIPRHSSSDTADLPLQVPGTHHLHGDPAAGCWAVGSFSWDLWWLDGDFSSKHDDFMGFHGDLMGFSWISW